MIKKEELEIVQFVLEKSGMFLINRVEDFHLLVTGIIIGKEKNEQERLNEFFNDFSKFVSKKTDDKLQGEYYKVIRYYSSSDYSSMELLKDYFSEFLTTHNRL